MENENAVDLEAVLFSGVVANAVAHRYEVRPFDDTRVQVTTPSPDAFELVSAMLTRAGIKHRRNGNDAIADVPQPADA